MKAITKHLRKEPVLWISAALAVVSLFFSPPSAKYLSYIDFKTLACLFCLMTAVMGLQREGMLERISLLISSRVKQLRALALFLVFLCFFCSMLITNDVALIAIVPLTLGILGACGLSAWSAFIVVLQTIAANIGSSLTPFGNPQNLYLFSRYQIPLSDFILTTLPLVLSGGLLLAGSCLLIPVTPLSPPKMHIERPIKKRNALVFGLLFCLSVAAVLDLLPFWLVTAVVLAAAFAVDPPTLLKVDYSLLFTFVFIFLFVGNLGSLPAVHAFLSSITRDNTLLAGILTSQVTSNVPAALLLSGFTDRGKTLLLGVNIGGLGTLIASMASVISYKLYAGVHKSQTLKFFKLFTLWNVLFLAVLTTLGLVIYH